MTIDDRLREIIRECGRSEWGFWRRLAEASGISHRTWNSFFHGSQRSTPAMIEAAGALWPEYAFWLCAGLIDPAGGHIAPEKVTASIIERRVVKKAEWKGGA